MPYEITQCYQPPGRGSISRPYPGRCYGRRYAIYPPIKDERLSRPGKRLAQSRYRSAGYTRCHLVKPDLPWPSTQLDTVSVNK